MNYGISDLAKKTGLSIHTLRFYEKEGLLRHVERTPSGRRVYNDKCLGCLVGIIILKKAGLSLPQIKRFFDSTLEGNESLPERLELLQKAHANLMEEQEELQRSLQFLNQAIQYSQNAITAAKHNAIPEDEFPFLTLKGMIEFPFMSMKNGKLELFIPEGKDINTHKGTLQN